MTIIAPINVKTGSTLELLSGKILELNMAAFLKYGYVLCYRDGYIIGNETSTGEYAKLSEGELFKR